MKQKTFGRFWKAFLAGAGRWLDACGDWLDRSNRGGIVERADIDRLVAESMAKATFFSVGPLLFDATFWLGRDGDPAGRGVPIDVEWGKNRVKAAPVDVFEFGPIDYGDAIGAVPNLTFRGSRGGQ